MRIEQVNRLLVEVLVILLLLVANGVFAMAELAVVSARKARLQQRASKGDARAQQALAQANNPNELLSTVQIGITLIGILAGAFGGATIAEEIAAVFRTRVSWLEAYSEALEVGLVVIVITYLSLILGELAPKRLALYNPEAIAMRLARPMQVLAKITRPVNRLLNLSTDAVVRLVGGHPSKEPAVTEEEVRVLIEQGTQIGIFEREEEEMIKGVLRLDDQSLGGLMTPRRQVVWLDLAETLEETRHKILHSGHGRFPVTDGNEEEILGIVHTKDLLGQVLSDQPLDLKAVMRPALFVPEGTLVLDLLAKIKQQGSDMAIVIDEYGSAGGNCHRKRYPGDDRGGAAFRSGSRRAGSHAARGWLLAGGRDAEHQFAQGDAGRGGAAGGEAGALPDAGWLRVGPDRLLFPARAVLLSGRSTGLRCWIWMATGWIRF